MWDDRYLFITTIRVATIVFENVTNWRKVISLMKKITSSTEIDNLTKITTLSDDILLIKKSFPTITFLIITKYVVIVTFLTIRQAVIVTILVFEIIKSKSSIRNKLNAFRVRNSYKTWINVRIVKLYLMKLFNIVDILKKMINHSFTSSRTTM